MNTKLTCPGCQKPLEPNRPDGLCPECLLKAGLSTGVDLGPDSQAESGRTPFVAPSVGEVARVFPQLDVLGFLGQGGMGAVYQARQKALDRVVALKILPPGIGKDPAFAERFTREAKALARLNHPGVVTIYEFGQADGLFYFLMEFVDGMSLRHLLEVERISAREALAIVPQICDALQYAHDQGIVHRDIKPENILLDRQGRVKVADFGLAKLVGMEALTPARSHPMGEGGAAAPVEGTPASAALTEAGKVMGTPQYMAPEQREHPAAVDHRADIYSLGVVFYQMLTGELPAGQTFAPPSQKVLIDVRLDEVVLRALEKEPERRYQQASVLKQGVETILSTPPSRASTSPVASPVAAREASATQWVIGAPLLGVGLLALTGLLAWFWWWVFRNLLYPHQIDGLRLGGPSVRVSWFEDLVYNHWTALIVLGTLVTAGCLCGLILRWAWRAASKPAGGGMEKNVTEARSAGFFQRRFNRSCLMWLIGICAILLITYAFFRDRFRAGADAAAPEAAAVVSHARKQYAEHALEYETKQLGVLQSLSKSNLVPQADVERQELKVAEAKKGLAEILDAPVKQPILSTTKLESASFGPVIGRVVNHTGSNCFINLDTGEVVTPPTEVFAQGSQAAMRWTEQHGIDAGGFVDDPGRGLIGFDMVAVPVSDKSWQGIQVYSLQEMVASSKPGNPVYLSAGATLPTTFLFATREGGMGVLQITGFIDKPPGVKIRYKLVQTPAKAPATPESAAGQAVESVVAPRQP